MRLAIVLALAILTACESFTAFPHRPLTKLRPQSRLAESDSPPSPQTPGPPPQDSRYTFISPAKHNSLLSKLSFLLVPPLLALTPIPASPLAILHLLSFATNFGCNFYTTFILGLAMFKNLPRRTFGKLQAVLFPKYFQLLTAATLLQLVTARVLPVSKAPLLVSLGATVLNLVYVEPTSTSVMLSRHKLEDEGNVDSAEFKALKSKFGKLHGMSSLANLVALAATGYHGAKVAMLLPCPISLV